MKPQPGVLARKTLAVVRHNVLTVAAWLDCPDLDIPAQRLASQSLRELIRDLKITGPDLDRRKVQLGIEEARR